MPLRFNKFYGLSLEPIPSIISSNRTCALCCYPIFFSLLDLYTCGNMSSNTTQSFGIVYFCCMDIATKFSQQKSFVVIHSISFHKHAVRVFTLKKLTWNYKGNALQSNKCNQRIIFLYFDYIIDSDTLFICCKAACQLSCYQWGNCSMTTSYVTIKLNSQIRKNINQKSSSNNI